MERLSDDNGLGESPKKATGLYATNPRASRCGFFAAIPFAALALCLASCEGEYPKHYEVGTIGVVPDSLRDDVANCIQGTMRGASNGLTTSDYEDVDDAIQLAEWACSRAYAIDVPCLVWVYGKTSFDRETINPVAMTAAQIDTLDRLRFQ